MQSHKSKSVYPQVAEQLGIPVEDVSILNNFFWKSIRTQLSNLSHPSVNISGLGSFDVMHWNLDKRVNKLNTKVERWENKNTTGNNPILMSYIDDLNKVKNVKQLSDAEKERCENVKLIKTQYKHEKYNKTVEK